MSITRHRRHSPVDAPPRPRYGRSPCPEAPVNPPRLAAGTAGRTAIRASPRGHRPRATPTAPLRCGRPTALRASPRPTHPTYRRRPWRAAPRPPAMRTPRASTRFQASPTPRCARQRAGRAMAGPRTGRGHRSRRPPAPRPIRSRARARLTPGGERTAATRTTTRTRSRAVAEALAITARPRRGALVSRSRASCRRTISRAKSYRPSESA